MWFYDIYFGIENPYSSRGSSDSQEGPGLIADSDQDSLKSNQEEWSLVHTRIMIMMITANFLLELRDAFNCTTAAICFVSERVS